MIEIVTEIILISWIGYNTWRVFSSPRNAVKVGAGVKARCPRKFAFQTYMKVKEFYLLLDKGHKKYEISGKDLLKDVVIDVWETAGFQFVKHKYKVAELISNERMKLVSEKSQVTVFGLIRGISRSEVEFRFTPDENDQTILGLTIAIIFPNWFRHLMARIFFTEIIWRSHARREMIALARIMEERFAKETT